MTNVTDIVDAIIAVEDGTASPLETLETYGLLWKTETVWGLQGSWQRAVLQALDEGLIDETGNVTDHAIDLLGALPEEG